MKKLFFLVAAGAVFGLASCASKSTCCGSCGGAEKKSCCGSEACKSGKCEAGCSCAKCKAKAN